MMLVLGMCRVSGSSLGLYATNNGASEREAGVLTGPPRPIRSDEWVVRTPWVLRQVERGLRQEVPGAVGIHDAAILYDLPTSGWQVLLRPQTAGYLLFGTERAFAIEWWAFFAIQLLGVYALLLTLTGRVAVSALASSLVTLSPVTQWWTTPATFTTIGYGSLATALVIAAYKAKTDRGRLALSVLGGLAFASFLVALYPPWQIGTALILVPVAVAFIMADLRRAECRRIGFRSLLIALVVALSVGGTLFVGFVVSHRPAVEALSDTVYPGKRLATVGGGTDLRVLLGSTFDYFSSEKPFSLVNGTNQSENSSALPLLLPVSLSFLALLVRRRIAGSRSSAALVGCLIGGAVLVAWMLLPIPADTGRLLLLTKVPAPRLLPSLGLAGVIGLALLVSHQMDSKIAATWLQLLVILGVVGAALAWGARSYTVEGSHINMKMAIGFMLVVLLGIGLSMSRWPLPGLALLVLFSLWQASFINPLQKGLSPLTKSALRTAIDSLQKGAPTDAGWLALSVDATVKGTLTAAGVNNLSGVSPYPDRAGWHRLDPLRTSEDIWNRYAHVSFLLGPPGTSPAFSLRGPDDIAVTVDPCSPVLRDLGVRFVVTQSFEIGSCVREVAKVLHGSSDVMVYEY